VIEIYFLTITGSSAYPCPCQCPGNFGQLDLQLLGCHDHTRCIRLDQVQDLHHFCSHVSLSCNRRSVSVANQSY
jgi:hypothetical protein